MQHSVIPPSAANIWGRPDGCPGYVLMAQMYPETEESVEAREGTAAHELGYRMIDGAVHAGHGSPTRDDTIGKAASNGVLFTEEMWDAASIYADDVVAVARRFSVFGGPNLMLEHRVHAPRVNALSNGTLDASIYARAANTLFLWDFKFGHDPVDVYGNRQLINYLAGLLDEFGIDGYEDQRLRVVFRIVQPRAYSGGGPIREWVVYAGELRAYINQLAAQAALALSPDAECRSGSHCKHCSARYACKAALAAGTQLYEAVAKPMPQELNPQELGVQLAIVRRAREQLEYLETAYEEQVKALGTNGTQVPGWTVRAAYGRASWTRPAAEIIAMGTLLGIDLAAPPKAKTPNQARKAGVNDDLVAAFSERRETGVKIEQDDGSKARRVFSPIGALRDYE